MKLFDKNEWKLLWPFYLEAFLGTFLFILPPFMVVYFNSINLSLAKIGILMAITPLAMLLFEIPTGAISDLYGRKFSVLLGWTLAGINCFIIPFFKSYYALLFLLFLQGIFFTFTSGSYEAWVVDLLKGKKQEKLIQNFFSKKQSLYNLAFVFSGILGVFLVRALGISVIWYATGFCFLFSVLLLVGAKEIHKKQEARIKESFIKIWNQTRVSIKYSYKHPVLFYLLAVTFIFGLVFSVNSFISWTPFLKSFNFPDYAFGYLWSASGILGIIAPVISQKLSKKYRIKSMLIFSSSIILIYGLLVLTANNLIFALFLPILFFAVADFENPLTRAYTHKFMPSKMRATIGSLESMLFSLAGIISLGVAGFLIEKIGARYSIFLSAVLMIPIIFLYLRIKEKHK
jgi:MFS family permease